MSCIKVCSHAEISQEETIIKQLLYKSCHLEKQDYRLKIHRCATRGISCLKWMALVRHTQAHFWQVQMQDFIRNKTPAQAFTPPAEKKMGKKWTFMYNRTGREKHEVANFLNSYHF